MKTTTAIDVAKGVAIVVIGYIVAAPYITVYQMKTAAKSKNGEALSEHIDFPSLRQSLKDQMNAMFMKVMTQQENKDNPFMALATAFSGIMVDKMVDAYVTPPAITMLMKGEKPASEPNDKAPAKEATEKSPQEPFADVSMSYESLNKFSITIEDQKSADNIKFVLRRKGLAWKLTEIILPPAD